MSAAAAPAIPGIIPLPAILRGVAEVEIYLRLPQEFVAAWIDAPPGAIPAMPHFQCGGTKTFHVPAVLAWLEQYHGYGGDMRPTSQRPSITRTRTPRPKST